MRFLLLQCSYGFSVNDDVLDQELGLYKAQTKLPFNAFGTMAMARDVRIPNMNILLVICLNRIPLSLPCLIIVDRSLMTTLLQAKFFGY